MIRVLKYKLYALFHMVSFYVIMLIMTVWCLLSAVDYADEEDVENLFNFAKCYVLDSGLLSVFFAIALAIFFTAEYKNGFIKSIATNMSKPQMVVCNLIVSSVIYVIYTIYMSFVAIITGKVIEPESYFGSMTGFLEAVGIAYVVYIGFAALLLAVSMLARGTAWPIVVGMMICTQLTNIMTAAINAIFDYNISKYQISYYLANIADDKAATMTAGCVYLVLFGLLSLLIVKKKDV